MIKRCFKKMIAAAAAGALTLSLMACGGGSSTGSTAAESTETESTKTESAAESTAAESTKAESTAAESLRPYTPKRMKTLFWERTRLWSRFGLRTSAIGSGPPAMSIAAAC